MTTLSFWTLLGILARSSAVLLIAAAVAALCARQAAAIRHAVWAGGFAAMLLVPLSSVTSLPPLVRVTSPRLFAASRVATKARADGATGPARDHAASLDPAWAPAEPRIMVDGHRFPEPSVAEWLVMIWLAGLAILVGRLVFSHLAAASLVRRSRPVTDEVIQRCWDSLQSGGPRDVALRESSEVASPATAGLFRHVVLLPASVSSWNEGALRMVLQHEMAHVRRLDGIIDGLGALACAAHWYNPFVWRAARAMARERERACDDRVLASGTGSRAYADVLLANAAAFTASVTRASMLAFAGTMELETRLLAILDEHVPRHAIPRWTIVVCLAAGGTTAILAATVQGEAAVLPDQVASPTRATDFAPSPARNDSTQRLPSPEPDRLGDSVAAPQSERLAPFLVPTNSGTLLRQAAARLPAYFVGSDSALAVTLAEAMARPPRGTHDLVRERAAWALLIGREGRLIEPLVDALADDNWRVRAQAAWALGVSGAAWRRDARAMPRLLNALNHPVWRVRAAAMFALRLIEDSSATPAMERALGDAAWQVRVSAVEFFSAMHDANARAAIEPMLHDRHMIVRVTARAALETLPTRTAH